MFISEIRVAGLRTLADVRLKTGALTVVIGENGSGKSSLIEACEILRKAADPDFFKELRRMHGGVDSLLRQGADELTLGVRMEGEERVIEYDFTLGKSDRDIVVLSDKLTVGPDAQTKAQRVLWHRQGTQLTLWNEVAGQSVTTTQPLLLATQQALLVRQDFGQFAQFAAISPAGVPGLAEIAKIGRTAQLTLEAIEVHLPFEVLPAWGSRTYKRSSALREENMLDRVERLDLLGGNLANVYYALRNENNYSHWQETMDIVRLGLGDQIEDIQPSAGADGGKVVLRIKYRGMPQAVPSWSLSDGTLAFLAFVALYRFRRPKLPSLLAFDEPEPHFHPALLQRVLDFFEAMSAEFPVLLTTHSDRLLDGLSNPSQSAVLCGLDEHQATRLRRPDPQALESWLHRYRGLGSIRAEGHDASIWASPDEPK